MDKVQASLFQNILTTRNRGMLLDLVIFSYNLVLISSLTKLGMDIFTLADQGVPSVKPVVALILIGMVFLNPAGAVLKRWPAHQRNPSLETPDYSRLLSTVYFLSTLTFSLLAGLYLGEISGIMSRLTSISDNRLETALLVILFLCFLFGIPALALINANIVFKYFEPPKHAPRLSFLTKPQAELAGDACIFLNMICFQTYWQLLMADTPNAGFGTKIFYLLVGVFIVYLPPRILYLVEDGRRPLTWLTMLVANLPFVIHFLFGINF